MRFFLFLCIFFVSCYNDTEAVKEFISLENLPIEKIEEAEILHTENGILKVQIIAANIERYKDAQPQLVFSNGLEIIFFNDSGLVKSTLTAERAEVDEPNKIMTAIGNVILTSLEGKKLETQKLVWEEKKNLIYTKQKVVITSSKEVIEGEGFRSNTDFSEYSISKIHGTFKFDTPTD